MDSLPSRALEYSRKNSIRFLTSPQEHSDGGLGSAFEIVSGNATAFADSDYVLSYDVQFVAHRGSCVNPTLLPQNDGRGYKALVYSSQTQGTASDGQPFTSPLLKAEDTSPERFTHGAAPSFDYIYPGDDNAGTWVRKVLIRDGAGQLVFDSATARRSTTVENTATLPDSALDALPQAQLVRMEWRRRADERPDMAAKRKTIEIERREKPAVNALSFDISWSAPNPRSGRPSVTRGEPHFAAQPRGTRADERIGRGLDNSSRRHAAETETNRKPPRRRDATCSSRCGLGITAVGNMRKDSAADPRDASILYPLSSILGLRPCSLRSHGLTPGYDRSPLAGRQ